jgi:penicillin amidase
VIALRWSALDADNQTVLAGLRANRAQSADEMIAAFAAYHSPMQNVVTADVAGGVAFKAVGKVPLRKPGNDIRGIAPSPGWEERYDWDGWLPYSANARKPAARAIEAKGWWSTANQRITPPAYPFFMGQDWTVPYRYDRIEQLLAATPRHDVASMQKIQADQLSPATVKLLPFLQKTLAQPVSHPLADAVRKAMAGFDGAMRADQPAPLVFAAWADELTRGIVGGKLGEATFRPLYGKRHFRSHAGRCAGAPGQQLVRQRPAARRNPPRRWCARWTACRRNTAPTWAAGPGAVRTWRCRRTSLSAMCHGWRLGSTCACPRAATPSPSTWASTGPPATPRPFANRQAASLRAVYDMADPENSRFIYQTGQSGLVFSGRYRDMRDSWAAVQYRPLQMNPPAFAHQLTLRP